MLATLPNAQDLAELSRSRNDASVTLYLPSSPLPAQSEQVRIALKNAVANAIGQLAEHGVDARKRADILERISNLDRDDDFWGHQARSLALFVSPQDLRAFRLPVVLRDSLVVGDRYDLGPLLHTFGYPHGGYVLAISERTIRLYALTGDSRPTEVELTGLPDDLHTVLEHTTTPDQADPPRADGANGQKTEQQRYCRIVQDAVLKRIGDATLPLILCATRELEPAYRVVNSYSRLLERGIQKHPDSLSPIELADRARDILADHRADELREWREVFGTKRSNGRASSDLEQVARAATLGAVDELLFDVNATLEGSVDENGQLRLATAHEPEKYNVVHEIAVRVLAARGTVIGVSSVDLPENAPVAATLRYPLHSI